MNNDTETINEQRRAHIAEVRELRVNLARLLHIPDAIDASAAQVKRRLEEQRRQQEEMHMLSEHADRVLRCITRTIRATEGSDVLPATLHNSVNEKAQQLIQFIEDNRSNLPAYQQSLADFLREGL